MSQQPDQQLLSAPPCVLLLPLAAAHPGVVAVAAERPDRVTLQLPAGDCLRLLLQQQHPLLAQPLTQLPCQQLKVLLLPPVVPPPLLMAEAPWVMAAS
jgi:hypothetical protein